MLQSIVRYSFVILPLVLLFILAGGKYGWHTKLIQAHHNRQTSEYADINSQRQVRNDSRRARIVPDIHTLRCVADIHLRNAKYYEVDVDIHSGMSEAEMARQDLIKARSHADAQLRHQHWWKHLTAPS